MIRFFRKFFTLKNRKYTQIELDDYTPRDYSCVAIRYSADSACEAIQQLEPHLDLSRKPPSFFQTKQRFLWSEAPLLPLPNCTLIRCRCRFVHYKDRRKHDRRYQFEPRATSSPLTDFDPGYVGPERRTGGDRRNAANPKNVPPSPQSKLP